MKMSLVRLAPLVVAAAVLAGCSTGPTKDQAAAESEDRSMTAEGAEGASTAAASAGGVWTGNPLDDPNSLLSSRTIYFDFDRSEIRSEYVAVVRAHALYLAANPRLSVTLEGHADERGTREYNLGLGERRGQSVRDFMLAEGVGAGQIQLVSYGEERPIELGHTESSWSANRRVELVY